MKASRKFTVAALPLLLGMAAQAAHAGQASTTPAAPSLSAVLAATPDLSVNGYVEASYTHFDTLISPSNPMLRAFDVRQNSFVLNQATLNLSYLPANGAGAAVVLRSGADARLQRYSESWPFNMPSTPFNVANAYAQYASGPMTVQAGKMWGLAGVESVATADTNISNSFLYWNLEPATVTGLRASYVISPAATAVVGVNNGWNFTSAVAQTSKTLELGLMGAMSKTVSYSLAMYRGQSPLFGGATNGDLQLIDATGTWNATQALSFQADFAHVTKQEYLGVGTGTGKADGLALYANYSFTPKWQLALRGETINDKDGIVTGVNGTSNHLRETTATINFQATPSLKLSTELRQDRSDLAIYAKSSGQSKSQTSLELQAVYAF